MMSSSGIAITSDSDVQIKAKGKITLDANQNIEQKSSGGDISLAGPVSYTHLRAHETVLALVCRLLLEKKKYQKTQNTI